MREAKIPTRAQKKFAGNGMNLFAITAWMSYIMSWCVPKSESQSIELPLVIHDDDDDEWVDSCRDA